MSFILSIIIGILAGFIAEKIMRSNGGLWTNLFIGVVGGMLGGTLASVLGLSSIGNGIVDRIVVATCGAVLFLAIWRYFKGTRPA